MKKGLTGTAILFAATLLSTYCAAAPRHLTHAHAVQVAHEERELIGQRFDVVDVRAWDVTAVGMSVGMSINKRSYTIFTAGAKPDTTSMMWLTRTADVKHEGNAVTTTYEIVDAIDAHARPGEFLVSCHDGHGNDNYAAYATIANETLATDKNGMGIAFAQHITPRVAYVVEGRRLMPANAMLSQIRCVNDGKQ